MPALTKRPMKFPYCGKIPATALAAALLLAQQPSLLYAESTSVVGCGPLLEARFIESAPRDRFEFANKSNDDWSITRITLDLSKSSGNLIFDTTEGGDGVEVSQPFNTEDTNLVSSANIPEDGEHLIEISFDKFQPELSFSFTIDVDDQLAESELGQIRVSGSEIKGATVLGVFLNQQGEEMTVESRFDSSGRILPSC